MPGSESLFHMHALFESDFAILMYISHVFALCGGQSGGHGKILPPQIVPGCAYLNGHSILVTA